MKAYANMCVHLVLCNNKFGFIAFVPLEVVLFDVDGTLYDSNPIHFVVLRELLQEVGGFFLLRTKFMKFFLNNVHFNYA
ncbi:putative phosphoglycolate phosphatase-like, domain 2, HAD superfamily [Helianthus debilis subsp. tardiflorus]